VCLWCPCCRPCGRLPVGCCRDYLQRAAGQGLPGVHTRGGPAKSQGNQRLEVSGERMGHCSIRVLVYVNVREKLSGKDREHQAAERQ